jgi:hypothetical protein
MLRSRRVGLVLVCLGVACAGLWAVQFARGLRATGLTQVKLPAERITRLAAPPTAVAATWNTTELLHVPFDRSRRPSSPCNVWRPRTDQDEMCDELPRSDWYQGTRQGACGGALNVPLLGQRGNQLFQIGAAIWTAHERALRLGEWRQGRASQAFSADNRGLPCVRQLASTAACAARSSDSPAPATPSEELQGDGAPYFQSEAWVGRFVERRSELCYYFRVAATVAAFPGENDAVIYFRDFNAEKQRVFPKNMSKLSEDQFKSTIVNKWKKQIRLACKCGIRHAPMTQRLIAMR